MYERIEASPIRRIVLFIIAGILVIALFWRLVWFIFFRNHHTDVLKPHNQTSQSQTEHRAPAGNSQDNNGSSTGGSSQNSSGVTSSTSTATPGLANTGPGNVVAPVVAATIIGGALYQVRLRRTVQPRE